MDGQCLITVSQNKILSKRIPDKNAGHVSRIIKHIPVHGLFKKGLFFYIEKYNFRKF